MEDIVDPKDLKNNKLQPIDRAFHDWYRFVLSYPPHLVRHYINQFELCEFSTILDPFCGTGTTLVESKKQNINSVGIEANIMAHFASKVKTYWHLEPSEIKRAALGLFNKAIEIFAKEQGGFRSFSAEQKELILKNSISDLPLHKCLILFELINSLKATPIKDFLLLALAYIAVNSASNLKFGPEVGVRKKKKNDANVFGDWFERVHLMISDLENLANGTYASSICYNADSRIVDQCLSDESIDAIITSPPYPNEKDYTRTTRLESVLLGFLASKNDLKALKKNLLRSNTRNVYVADDDDKLIEPGSRIDLLAREIERRRIALNKTSGFEKQYHRVTKLYFGGMKRHLAEMRRVLKYGAKLAYVVGDQASYLQVLIRTGEILADIAMDLGYEVMGIDLFRTRISTATGKQLREEVLLLHWKGGSFKNGRSAMKKQNRYDQLIKKVFFNNYKEGDRQVFFDRDEFEPIAKSLGLELPKNLGDIIYSYRYRNLLPKSITDLLAEDEEWIIRSIGKGKYKFAKSAIHRITPNPRLSKIKILDSTPEIIRKYALNDEQALLAILRYNRLVDIFLGVTCYSLQSHLRTSVPGTGQVETDEIYVGVSKGGQQYIIPIQAKGKSEQLGIVQIEQDFSVCNAKFQHLICRPIAAQFMEENLIALFEFEQTGEEVSIKDEKHYLIVPSRELGIDEVSRYNKTG